MTPSSIILGARRILNDRDSSGYRTHGDELLEYVNDFVKQLVRADPSLYIQTRQLTLVAGELQQIDRLSHNALMSVMKNADGEYVKEIDISAMEVQFRTWRGTAPGPVQEWARMKGDPWGFMVFPPAVADAVLTGRVSPIPPDLTDVGAEMVVSDTFRAAAAHYVAGRTLFKNTNTADAERGRGLIETAALFAGISNLGTP